MTSKRVFISGAHGLLGTTLTRKLKKKKYEVLAAPQATDLASALTCHEILDEAQPQLIVNLAALTNVDACEEFPEKALQVNAIVVKNIAEWIKKNPACHLIQISTDMVYNSPGYNKEEQISCLNEYAKSKLKGEEFANEVDGTILRTNFFGHSLVSHRKSFSDWLLQSFQGRIPLKLLTDVEFSPLNIATLCDQIEIVLQNPVSGVFNLGAKTALSKRDFAYKIAEVYGYDIQNHSTDVTMESLIFKAPRPHHMAMDVSKYERTFGVQLPTLEDEIQKLKSEEWRSS